jgi:hypothetical protein
MKMLKAMWAWSHTSVGDGIILFVVLLICMVAFWRMSWILWAMGIWK